VADERERKVWMKRLITVCGKLKDGTMVMVFDEEGICVRIWTQDRLRRKDEGEEEVKHDWGMKVIEWPNAQQTKTAWSNDAPQKISNNAGSWQTLARMRGMDMRDGERSLKGQAIGILLLIVNQEVAAEKIAGTGLLWLGDANYLSFSENTRNIVNPEFYIKKGSFLIY
jgi:hypothetical protein